MKRAKVVFSAIAILGVVAGAFAFKASRETDIVYTGPEAGKPCNITKSFVTTVAGTPNTFATFIKGANCVALRTVASDL